VAKFLRDNWLAMAMFAAQLVGWGFITGVTYMSLRSDIQATERRVDLFEKAVPAQIAYQVQANTADIGQLKADQRTTTALVNQVSGKLDVMASKIDFLVEQQRRQDRAGSEPR
jgi:hypothetical protein